MNEIAQANLRRYLLGQLDEKAREALAERYFADEEFFNELLEVENDLFDQYARGELTPTEKNQFTEYINGLPDGKFKLATATAFAKSAPVEPMPVNSAEITVSSSWWEKIGGLFFGAQFAPQYVFGGIILLALVAGYYFYLRPKQMPDENEQIAQIEKNTPSQTPEPSNIMPEPPDQPENRPQPTEKNAPIESPKEKREEVKPDKKSPAVPTIATFILTPALRSVNKPDTVSLKPETKIISLVIKLAPNEKAQNYRIILQLNEGNGPIVLTKENLKPTGIGQNRQVRLMLPARKLTRNSYKLTLQGSTAGQIEVTPEYYFEVKRN